MTLDPRPGAADRWLLYVAAFVRALATGMIGVLLGLYLASVGLSTSTLGIVVAAGLAGGAVATLIVTRRGDRLGRRRVLMMLALLSAAGAVAATFLRHPLALGLAAFVGMLNGMGRDRGPALALEQAVLPATATDDQRTRVIAWYNVLQDAGHALGSLMAGLPVLLRARLGLDEPESLRACLWLYAGLSALLLPIYARLSPGIELQARAAVVRLTRESKRILTRISGLFLLDALGGGFLTAALVSYYFFQRFGVGEATIGLLFFGARVANAVSHLAAAWLAKRIGLVNTMVFTHIPSSILLATVAFAPTFPVAAVLFLLREGLVEMDVPTRTSYVMAVVRPEERTVASGVTSLVRMGGWAVAPSMAGLLMQVLSPGAPLFVGAGLKIAYDVLLYTAFRRLRPPEERAAPEPAAPR